jgi:hypothetical protein
MLFFYKIIIHGKFAPLRRSMLFHPSPYSSSQQPAHSPSQISQLFDCCFQRYPPNHAGITKLDEITIIPAQEYTGSQTLLWLTEGRL